MADTLEREVKLRFATPDDARAAVVASGARPARPRRLQDDALFDTDDEALRRRRCVLRVRREGDRSALTFKGPVLPGRMKLREELETGVADGAVLALVLERLGLHVWFRYQKYREEFAADQVTIAVDETPVGTFVEVEGTEEGIATAAAALGRTTADYILDSYHGLFLKYREVLGFRGAHMVFDEPDRIT